MIKDIKKCINNFKISIHLYICLNGNKGIAIEHIMSKISFKLLPIKSHLMLSISK